MFWNYEFISIENYGQFVSMDWKLNRVNWNIITENYTLESHNDCIST